MSDLMKLTSEELMAVGPWPDAKAEIRRRLEQQEAEWQQPDDALLRIGAPEVPFLEQVEWMRKRLAALEDAVRPFMNQWRGKGPATREHYKRLAEVLDGK